jgi:hypothetical protein
MQFDIVIEMGLKAILTAIPTQITNQPFISRT